MNKFRSSDEWLVIFEAQQQSGLKIIDYCQQNAISTICYLWIYCSGADKPKPKRYSLDVWHRSELERQNVQGNKSQSASIRTY
jgi:hypothetical protein